jgi:hypothetical protein
MLEAHDQHPVRMSVRFQYGEQIVASLVGRETVAWDEPHTAARRAGRIQPHRASVVRSVSTRGEYPFRVGLCRQRRHPPGALLRTLVAP